MLGTGVGHAVDGSTDGCDAGDGFCSLEIGLICQIWLIRPIGFRSNCRRYGWSWGDSRCEGWCWLGGFTQQFLSFLTEDLALVVEEHSRG